MMKKRWIAMLTVIFVVAQLFVAAMTVFADDEQMRFVWKGDTATVSGENHWRYYGSDGLGALTELGYDTGAGDFRTGVKGMINPQAGRFQTWGGMQLGVAFVSPYLGYVKIPEFGFGGGSTSGDAKMRILLNGKLLQEYELNSRIKTEENILLAPDDELLFLLVRGESNFDFWMTSWGSGPAVEFVEIVKGSESTGESKTTYNSNDDFPMEVGSSGFLYESSEDGSTFSNMWCNSGTWFVQGADWSNNWIQKGKIELKKDAPWMSITFVAPYSGTLKVSDNKQLSPSKPLLYKTMHNETVLTEKNITGETWNVTNETLQVTAGDKIRVMLKNNGDDTATLWGGYHVKVEYSIVLGFARSEFAMQAGALRELRYTAADAGIPTYTSIVDKVADILEIDGKYYVRGIQPGVTVVRARESSGITQDCVVTVINSAQTADIADPSFATELMWLRESENLPIPYRANETDMEKISFSVSTEDAKVLKVEQLSDAGWTVTGLSGGEAELIMNIEGKVSIICPVTVIGAIDGIELAAAPEFEKDDQSVSVTLKLKQVDRCNPEALQTTVVMAAYDSSGALADCDVANKMVENTGETEFELSVPIAAGFTGKVRLFVWGALGTMKPWLTTGSNGEYAITN